MKDKASVLSCWDAFDLVCVSPERDSDSRVFRLSSSTMNDVIVHAEQVVTCKPSMRKASRPGFFQYKMLSI